MTFWETIESGEYVIFALAATMIAVLLVWSIRTGKLCRESKRYHEMMQMVRDHVMEGDVDNAVQVCRSELTYGAKLVCMGLSKIGHPISQIESSMNVLSSLYKKEMKKGLGWLKAFAVISPLLGIGGTLAGMIDKLRDVGELQSEVDNVIICGVMAPTLVTTVVGLGVGILSIVTVTALKGRINATRRHLDELQLEFTELLNSEI